MSPDGWYKTYKWAQEIQLILWYLWLGTGEFCLSTGKRRQWKRRWKKDHFALFQSLSHLFRPAPFVKCGRFFFWRLILKDFIQVKKTKVEFVVVCSRPPRALTWDQAPQGRGGGEGSLRTQTYFRSSLLSNRKRVETEKPRFPFPDYRSARFTCLFPNCGAWCQASPP